MTLLVEDERDAKRQIEIHKEIQRITDMEMQEATVHLDGAARSAELLPAKMALLAESEAILKRQIARLQYA